jgi:nucleotide-binding universal stress UspA family protein
MVLKSVEEVLMYKKILVPLDGSKLAEEVLPFVRTIANFSNVEIIVLRVAEYSYSFYSTCYEYPPSNPDLAITILEKKREVFEMATAYLERIVSTLKTSGIKATAETCDGPVVEAILAATDRLHIDLVILSPYGQSGYSHWTIGAIADRVLHEAQVPVILFRPTSPSVIGDLAHVPHSHVANHLSTAY